MQTIIAQRVAELQQSLQAAQQALGQVETHRAQLLTEVVGLQRALQELEGLHARLPVDGDARVPEAEAEALR